MAIDFPNSPSLNQTYTVGSKTWLYDGEKWVLSTETTLGTGVYTSTNRPTTPYDGMMIYETDTNLVRIWNGTAWKTLAYSDYTSGSVIQVASTTKTDTYTDSSASGTLTTITGLSVSITPTSSSSKVFVKATVNYGAVGGNRAIFALTGGNTSTAYRGDSAGSRRQVATGAQSIDANDVVPVTLQYLDSPATTSSITYAVQAADIAGGTLQINRSSTDTNGTNFARYASTITAMEIAG